MSRTEHERKRPEVASSAKTQPAEPADRAVGWEGRERRGLACREGQGGSGAPSLYVGRREQRVHRMKLEPEPPCAAHCRNLNSPLRAAA